MAVKKTVSPEEIVEALNSALSKSNALDGDCRKCRVRQVCRVTDEELEQLGRNWNVYTTNGECGGDCRSVLVEIALAVGRELDASWE